MKALSIITSILGIILLSVNFFSSGILNDPFTTIGWTALAVSLILFVFSFSARIKQGIRFTLLKITAIILIISNVALVIVIFAQFRNPDNDYQRSINEYKQIYGIAGDISKEGDLVFEDGRDGEFDSESVNVDKLFEILDGLKKIDNSKLSGSPYRQLVHLSNLMSFNLYLSFYSERLDHKKRYAEKAYKYSKDLLGVYQVGDSLFNNQNLPQDDQDKWRQVKEYQHFSVKTPHPYSGWIKYQGIRANGIQLKLYQTEEDTLHYSRISDRIKSLLNDDEMTCAFLLGYKAYVDPAVKSICESDFFIECRSFPKCQ